MRQLEENEEEVNKIYREVIKNARLSEDVLGLEYITGKKLSLDSNDLPELLKFRIEGIKTFLKSPANKN
jgi:hypothetical protein